MLNDRRIPKNSIPNTFAPNVENEYFTVGGLIACMRGGAFNSIELPPEAKEMLRNYKPRSQPTPIAVNTKM